MAKITLKTYNYYPDFQNENLVNRANNLIETIRTRNAIGYENFGFHELALNFSYNSINEIKNFAKKIVDKNIKNLLIFCSSEIIENFQAGFNYLFNNDLLTANKINFIFFNANEFSEQSFAQLKQCNHLLTQESTAILFSSLITFNDAFLNFIKLIVNKMQANLGFYNAFNNVYLISKEELEEQLFALPIEENNKLIIPSILDYHFAFFSEINLLLLFLKGANIEKILEGYSIASFDYTNKIIDNNLAFKLGYINFDLKKDKKIHFNIGLNSLFNNFLAYQNNFLNLNYINKNKSLINAIFPYEIAKYGQFLLENNRNLFVTFYELNNEQTDFIISDEIYLKDLTFKMKNNKLSFYNKQVNKSLINTVSNIASLPVCRIKIEEADEISLGQIVALMYWSLIYEAYLNKTNPFLFLGDDNA
ncbi:glucose-6-phosphate isomerase [Mycoplasmopsis iners]|uniref:hypothetical protein n=1 Tax=Mycoplasmopsis iners TaxID=76630 RepID=UPI000560D3FF|nr:hypothetical protein [Mycoplasmopsis iners]